MATGTILLPILGCRVDATWPPGYEFVNGRPRLAFQASYDEIVYWTFRMPGNYGSAPVLHIQYTMASATSGDVVFGVEVMAVTPGDAAAMSTDSYDTMDTVTDAVPGTAGYLDETDITVSHTDGLAAGDYVSFKFRRNTTEFDTAPGDARVWTVTLTYTRA